MDLKPGGHLVRVFAAIRFGSCWHGLRLNLFGSRGSRTDVCDTCDGDFQSCCERLSTHRCILGVTTHDTPNTVPCVPSKYYYCPIQSEVVWLTENGSVVWLTESVSSLTYWKRIDCVTGFITRASWIGPVPTWSIRDTWISSGTQCRWNELGKKYVDRRR